MIDPENMPCCPICDNAILDWEPAETLRSGGAQCLAHSMCLHDEDEEDDEDEDSESEEEASQ